MLKDSNRIFEIHETAFLLGDEGILNSGLNWAYEKNKHHLLHNQEMTK